MLLSSTSFPTKSIAYKISKEFYGLLKLFFYKIGSLDYIFNAILSSFFKWVASSIDFEFSLSNLTLFSFSFFLFFPIFGLSARIFEEKELDIYLFLLLGCELELERESNLEFNKEQKLKEQSQA